MTYALNIYDEFSEGNINVYLYFTLNLEIYSASCLGQKWKHSSCDEYERRTTLGGPGGAGHQRRGCNSVADRAELRSGARRRRDGPRALKPSIHAAMTDRCAASVTEPGGADAGRPDHPRRGREARGSKAGHGRIAGAPKRAATAMPWQRDTASPRERPSRRKGESPRVSGLNSHKEDYGTKIATFEHSGLRWLAV